MLAGQPKTGKSWFCLDIAQVLTDEGSSVFYIAAEDNERRLQSRLKAKSFSNPQNLKLHAGLSQEQPIPRGSDALTYLRELHDAFNESERTEGGGFGIPMHATASKIPPL